MLVAIQTLTRRSLEALLANRTDGPFFCPECKEDVSLRKGTVSIPHFSHRPKHRCAYGTGEALLHRQCKTEIFQALRNHPSVQEVHLEHRLDEVRPDIFAIIRGIPVAIEVQLSNLSPEVISRRTSAYTRLGIHVLWLLQWTPKLNRRVYSPRRFERWLHAAYFGRVYFWTKGLTVIPYQFETHSEVVPRMRYRTRTGKVVVINTHRKFSKRFRHLIRGEPLDLVKNFGPVTRHAWEGPKISVPSARLYLQENGWIRWQKPE